MTSYACSICHHPKIAAIDALLVSGVSIYETARRFGLSRSTIRRHLVDHPSPSYTEAVARRKAIRELPIADQIEQYVDMLAPATDSPRPTALAADRFAARAAAVRPVDDDVHEVVHDRHDEDEGRSS